MRSLLDLIAGTLGVPPADVIDASEMSTIQKWDSPRHVILMTELEMNYGIEIAPDDMAAATSGAKNRDLLKRHGLSAAD